MTNTFFQLCLLFIFVPVLSFVLLSLNFLLAPYNPDSEKVSTYECGFSPSLGQTRDTFHIAFVFIGLAFLIFDLEVLLIFPVSVSLNFTGMYGLVVALSFFIILTVGYIVELMAGNLRISNQSINKFSSGL